MNSAHCVSSPQSESGCQRCSAAWGINDQNAETTVALYIWLLFTLERRCVILCTLLLMNHELTGPTAEAIYWIITTGMAWNLAG